MKRNPYLRGEYSETVAEDTKAKASVVLKSGLDSTVTTLNSVQLGSEGPCLMVCAGSEKGVKRVNEDLVMVIPSLRTHINELPSNEREDITSQTHNEELRLPPLMDVSLVGVLDGHGGRKVAEYVLNELPKVLARFLLSAEDVMWHDSKLTGEMLGEIFSQLDRKLVSDVPTSSREGCTVTVLVIPREISLPRVYCANVGDTTSFLWRKGTDTDLTGVYTETIEEDQEPKMFPIELSTPHKPWRVAEKERIMATDATIERGRVNGSLDVSRSLGDITFKRFGVTPIPSVSYVDFEPSRDKFITVSSDGLNVLGDGERICRRIENTLVMALKHHLLDGTVPAGTSTVTGPVLKSVVKSLVDEAVTDYKCQDNCTLIVIHPADHSIV